MNRSSNTASANPPEACASLEYVDTRLKPFEVTTVGVPTRTQLRTTHGATTTMVTRAETSSAPPARPPDQPCRDHDDEELRARPGEHEQSAHRARPRRPIAHEQQDHRQQEREPERLAEKDDVVREQGRVDANDDAGRDAGAVPGDVGAEEGSEDDDHHTKRDVHELAHADVDTGDPIDGAEQCRVQRRTERGRVLEGEREDPGDAVALREGFARSPGSGSRRCGVCRRVRTRGDRPAGRQPPRSRAVPGPSTTSGRCSRRLS